MDTQVNVKAVDIGPEKVFLILKNQVPHVEWKNEVFSHLWFLVAKLPLLSDPAYIETFAEISNFFWKGQLCQYITSISDYQQHYLQQVTLEKQHPADVFPYRLTDYKIFDVSVMHAPKIEKGQLIYFVYNVQTGLPYRVVCPFPYPTASTLVHYQILPLMEE